MRPLAPQYEFHIPCGCSDDSPAFENHNRMHISGPRGDRDVWVASLRLQFIAFRARPADLADPAVWGLAARPLKVRLNSGDRQRPGTVHSNHWVENRTASSYAPELPRRYSGDLCTPFARLHHYTLCSSRNRRGVYGPGERSDTDTSSVRKGVA